MCDFWSPALSMYIMLFHTSWCLHFPTMYIVYSYNKVYWGICWFMILKLFWVWLMFLLLVCCCCCCFSVSFNITASLPPFFNDNLSLPEEIFFWAWSDGKQNMEGGIIKKEVTQIGMLGKEILGYEWGMLGKAHCTSSLGKSIKRVNVGWVITWCEHLCCITCTQRNVEIGLECIRIASIPCAIFWTCLYTTLFLSRILQICLCDSHPLFIWAFGYNYVY